MPSPGGGGGGGTIPPGQPCNSSNPQTIVECERAKYGHMSNGQTRNWAYMLGFAAMISVTVYVIVDIEFPRVGFIRVEAYDRGLAEVRSRMH